MFGEFDLVVLTALLPNAPYIPRGTRGHIVHIYPGTDAFEVDFVEENGEPLDVETVHAPVLRLVSRHGQPQPIYAPRQAAG